MTTNNHEVIFAIVNSGYAEDAMDVAREHGARGGTIINGRGVAREDEAAFFGISIHADKELLMMVVEKTAAMRSSTRSISRWECRKRRRESFSRSLFPMLPAWHSALKLPRRQKTKVFHKQYAPLPEKGRGAFRCGTKKQYCTFARLL